MDSHGQQTRRRYAHRTEVAIRLELEFGKIIRKIGAFIIILIFGGILLLALPVCGWLLFNAQTWVGQGIAVMLLGIAALPMMGGIWYQKRATFWLWSILAAGSVIALIGLVILFNTPTGQAEQTSPIRHRFTQATNFQPYTLTNIIPESEQVNLGFALMPYLDPILTFEQSQKVSVFARRFYYEMESDPDFHQLGSVMGWAYAELRGKPFDVGHYYLYVPKGKHSEPLPAIVFLHGSGGNFKVYMWLWSKLAEKQQVVIIAPSFGFGNWGQPGGQRAVVRALQDAASVVRIDEDRIYLAGLSNGGLGVSRLAEAMPDKFRGLIFISPVMATEIVDRKQFLDEWKGRPALILFGEADRRVPENYIRKRIANFEAGGVDVTAVYYPGEDHFLFFSQAEDVLEKISNWLSRVNEP